MNNVFVDSNIVLYIMDVDELKKIISRKLLSNNPNISAQVLTELANVCTNRFKYKKHELLILWTDLLRDCTLIPTIINPFKKQFNW